MIPSSSTLFPSYALHWEAHHLPPGRPQHIFRSPGRLYATQRLSMSCVSNSYLNSSPAPTLRNNSPCSN
ncbi:hypothetical protein BJV74DRAFT_850688 [Russula compacta]|nr:hypothetical protein BJV74DRAFT_850688 [Russula compacta]